MIRASRGVRIRARSRMAVTLSIMVVSSVFAALPGAVAGHGSAQLGLSTFEIDIDANLKNDDGAGVTDWADLAHALPTDPEVRAVDLATGQSDNAYKGGVKEDTMCPDETTGTIPNNKSDLLTFHVYEEPGDPGFLNLAWSRVSEPSGTTLMDFEFNQSTTPCPQGPNVVRTDGDLLLEYAIDQGGAQASISGRFWDGTAEEWGPALNLSTGTDCDGGPCAVGTINDSAIPDGESDGLGPKDARTFGEAQIDLNLIFDENTCTSFGSAMLKSRSSDSFTSQLKDFIAPIPVDLQNCGNVIIRKQTLPDEDPNSTSFGFTKSFATDPSVSDTFSLTDDGVKDFDDDVLFGTGYTVTEDAPPAGWSFVSVDCSASTGVTPIIAGPLVTFDIDADTDVLDCTYTNQALASLTFVKSAEIDDGTTFNYSTSGGLSPAAFGLMDGDSQPYSNLALGTYGATETVPAGWNLVSQDCDNGDTADAVTLVAGDNVTCTFVNEIERGAIKIVKTRKHAADGAGDHPHAGVDFTITHPNGTNETVTTNASGEACFEGLPVSVLSGTDYTVTETVPSGYVADGATAKGVTVTEGTCAGTPNTVTFANTPLTNITVSVDSQVDGGTASVIECWLGDIDADPADSSQTTGATGDGTLTIQDLLPTDPAATVTCVITIDP